MNVAIIVPAGIAEGPSFFAATVRSAGHRVVFIAIPSPQNAVDPCAVRGVELAFVEGYAHIPLRLACALAEAEIPLAAPPLHSIALLDHPLHWRRVLEREGVPVNSWLHVGPGTDLCRDPRVSVLGFPLRVIRLQAGSAASEVAVDRDGLATAVDRLNSPRGVIVERCPEGEALTVFTGLSVAGPLVGTALDDGRTTLTLGLARHIEHVLDLAGPCELAMVWERGRLLLQSIRMVADLGPAGAAFAVVGGEYSAFVESVLQAACTRS